MNKNKLEILIKMLKLSYLGGAKVNVILDSETSQYVYNLIQKDVIQNDIPIDLESIKDITFVSGSIEDEK